MIYGQIHKLLNYIHENNIHISDELLEEVLKSQLEPQHFAILKEKKAIIQIFLYPAASSQIMNKKFDFIMKMKDKVSFQKLKQLVQIYDWKWCEFDAKHYPEFFLACENPAIISRPKILSLIANQNDWFKMEKLRLACDNPNIVNNYKIFNKLASQDSGRKVIALLLACENPNILNNNKIFNRIASQNSWGQMQQLRLALDNPNIVNNYKIFNRIASQNSWEQMRELRLACDNPNILNNYKIFNRIASQNSWERMRELRLACDNLEILSNLKLLDLIANCNNWLEMRKLRLIGESSMEWLNNVLWQSLNDQKQEKKKQKELLTKMKQVNIVIHEKKIQNLDLLEDANLKNKEYVPSIQLVKNKQVNGK